SLGGGTVKLLLTVEDPDEMARRAIEAGASEVYPVAEEHGGRLGRIVDPFGHHWEIERPQIDWPPASGGPHHQDATAPPGAPQRAMTLIPSAGGSSRRCRCRRQLPC